MNTFALIELDNKEYAVFPVTYKDHKLPVLVDKEDFDVIKKMNKSWRCNNNGFISCSHTVNGIRKDVYLHELVMQMQINEGLFKKQKKSIVHINRVGLDNRRDNLMYDSSDKFINKNLKKKKRTIDMPADSGIDPDTIPTYIWYVKETPEHGSRFTVNISGINWSTTSSKHMTDKYKLEEAKMFVRHLLKTNNNLLEEYSMNGDYTKDGKDLLNSYYSLVHKVGYKNIEKFIPENNTLELLKPNYGILNHDEMGYLKDTREWIKKEW